jgi:aconitate hydratase
LLTTITYADGSSRQLQVLCRIDTEEELSYYRHGGILPFVLRNLVAAA